MPEILSQFRPKSLCNVTTKLISKIIVNCLRPFLKDIVSPTQSSFISGRSNSDNIVLVQEAAHSFNHKQGRVGYMMMEIDLEKAYDRIKWNFLCWVLCDPDLPYSLINLIMFCATATELNIMWNGEKTSFFPPTRGLHRQGDPLSPYLFVLCSSQMIWFYLGRRVQTNVMSCWTAWRGMQHTKLLLPIMWLKMQLTVSRF